MTVRGNIQLILLLSLALLPRAAFSEGGEILFGAAAITAAISPMVVTGIQANSQVNQAQTRANAANTISQINAQTALYQARTQSFLALAQADVQRNIAAYTQQSQTRDLLSQLQFMAYNRALDNQLQQQQFAAQMQYQSALVSLEFKKMELERVLAESQILSGESPTLSLASAQPQNGSVLSPIAQTLQGSLTSPSRAENNLTGHSGSDFSSASSSFGIKRALGRSISSGSTASTKRAVQSDLSRMIESAPNRIVRTQDARSVRRAIRTVRSQTH